MSNLIETLWKMMREKFGPENMDQDGLGKAYLYSQREISATEYRNRQLSEPCPHLLKFWLDNNEKITIGETITTQCSKCGGLFVGVFKGYYELGTNEKGESWILCRVCGMKSYHPKDIEAKYCENCHRFH